MMPSRGRSLSERWTPGEQAGQVRVRDRRGRLVAGEGHHRGLTGPVAEVARPQGLAAEVRPLHQRRPRHHEPVPARRGFVTEDGAETDLDLGHYERFVDE